MTSDINNVIWHYTIMQHFHGILSDGYIKTTNIYIEKNEKPAAWFSANNNWEITASKGSIKEGNNTRFSTSQEMLEQFGVLVRIGISRDTPGLLNWYNFKRESGIRSKTARGLEEIAYANGANPNDWYVIFDDVAFRHWTHISLMKDLYTWNTFSLDDISYEELRDIFFRPTKSCVTTAA